MSAAPTFRETAATAEAAQAGLLYERYARQLHGFCRARLSSREEAEDAVQHTFLNAYRSLRSGTVPRAEAAWMFAIAANVCRERRRSAWRRSRVEVVSDDGLVGERAAPEHSHEELTGVADALAELTPNQRRAILMREWQGLSVPRDRGRALADRGRGRDAALPGPPLARAKLDRSRGRIWGVANIGSALAWGKTLLGGTAGRSQPRRSSSAPGVTAASPFVPVHEAGAPRQRAVSRRRPGESAMPASSPLRHTDGSATRGRRPADARGSGVGQVFTGTSRSPRRTPATARGAASPRL